MIYSRFYWTQSWLHDDTAACCKWKWWNCSDNMDPTLNKDWKMLIFACICSVTFQDHTHQTEPIKVFYYVLVTFTPSLTPVSIQMFLVETLNTDYNGRVVTLNTPTCITCALLWRPCPLYGLEGLSICCLAWLDHSAWRLSVLLKASTFLIGSVFKIQNCCPVVWTPFLSAINLII